MGKQLTRRLTLAVLLAAALSSLAAAGVASGETSYDGKGVQGTGSFVIDPAVNTSSPNATLTCVVEGKPAARVVSTAVHSCELFKGTTRVAWAPASARQSPVWSTQQRMPASSVPAGVHTVCWDVSAQFDDTTSRRNSDCGTITIPPSQT